jgi:hypothetical protein
VGCIAVSGTGNASNNADAIGNSCGSYTNAQNLPGVAVGCVAVSGTGSASNTVYGHDSCGTQGPGAVGCVAVSGTGNASNTKTYTTNDRSGDCGKVWGTGCVAVSGTGNASNTTETGCGTAGHSVAVGCVAVTGSSSGSATNNTGGPCGTASAADPQGFVDYVTNPPTDPVGFAFWVVFLPDAAQWALPGVAIGCVDVTGPLP